MTRDFTSVGVIGLGTMGAGIVEVFARNGIDVIAVEVDEVGIEHGKQVLAGSTGRALARGKMTQDEYDALHARVTFTSDLSDLAACQLVVEAVPEHLDLKKELLGKVDAVVSPDAVLATNTSSLPVTEIAVATSNPKRVVGMHFFNPAPVQQFVEVIRTVITADDVFEDVKALAERLGKKPVIVGDKAGFIANALLFGYLNHGVSLRPVTSVGVVGSGTMATGIIEVFAKAGYAVTFVARSDEKVAEVLTSLGRSCARAVEKGRMEQDAADALLGRVAGATGREALADVDLVVEAIAEDLAVKQDLFRDLDRICKPGAILATT